MVAEAITKPPTMIMAMMVHKQQFCIGNPLLISVVSVNGRLHAEHREFELWVWQGWARAERSVSSENGGCR